MPKPASATFDLGTFPEQLTREVDEIAERLRRLDIETARARPAPGKWSIQEILGHLVDSAANNHQRFVRAQEVDVLDFPRYLQDQWVAAQGYAEAPWGELIELWRLYNRHIARVIARIPAEMAARVECRIAPYEPVTLAFLIEDYLVHLRHHIRRIDELAGS